MELGLSLRKTASAVGISLNTAFRWRHTLLAKMQTNFRSTQSAKRTLSIHRTVYSEKGKRGKSEQHLKDVVFSYIVSDNFGKAFIQTRSVLNDTKHISATEYVPDKALSQINRLDKTKTKLSYGVKTIHLQIDSWLRGFRGVASKYLNHYWAWFSYMSQIESNRRHTRIMMSNCL